MWLDSSFCARLQHNNPTTKLPFWCTVCYFNKSRSMRFIRLELIKKQIYWCSEIPYVSIDMWHIGKVRSEFLCGVATRTPKFLVWRLRLPTYRGADKSLARPGRKQATATEDFDFDVPYLDHNSRNISTIYLYNKTSTKEIFSQSNKIHWEVGRSKDLSAPLYILPTPPLPHSLCV